MNHYSQVIPESIKADFSPDKRFRYTLQMEFASDLIDINRAEVVTVILKNPSSADEKKSDATIRKVETFVYTRFSQARFLNIYNIFSLRATDAIELHNIMKESGPSDGIGPENDPFLIKLLKETDQLICAWGGRSGIDQSVYSQRIKDVKRIIKESYEGPVFQVVGAKPTNEPLHGLMWGYDYELIALSL